MVRVQLLVVLGIVSFFATGSGAAAETDADEQALQAVGLATDGPALLEFFRLRSEPVQDPKHLDELTRPLAHSSPAARERAMAELVARGAPAISALRPAGNDRDGARRAAA